MEITKEVAEAYLKGWIDCEIKYGKEKINPTETQFAGFSYPIKKKRGWPKGKKRK